MSVENAQVVRQYVFDRGPNYTDSPYILSERELAESENMFWEGELKTIPGSARIVDTVFAGTNTEIVGVHQYTKSTGQSYLIAVSNQGRMAYESGGSWTSIQTGLSTAANTYWDWVTFNDTLVALSGNNPVKKWSGSGGLSNLGGSPPMGRFATPHASDYVFIAGHTSAPSALVYNDTANIESWPIGNVLQIGRNDGNVITGLQRFGDTTAVFKESSIWLVSGSTPSDFGISPTPSDVGCIAPDSIVLTDAGIFFWSEAGPALFNGFKSNILGKRLRTVLGDEVDWSEPFRICAAYYPFKKQVLVSFRRPGQSAPDRILLLDLYHLTTDEDEQNTRIFWPITVGGATAMTSAKDSTGRRRIYMGHHNGYVTVWDEGTTFNNTVIVPRVRTRMLSLNKPDHTLGMRTLDIRTAASDAQLVVRFAVDGTDNFTTHPGSPYSLANPTRVIKQTRLHGDGTGYLSVGNVHQIELTTNSTTGFTLKGYEVGFEDLGRRELLNGA